jgi:putative transposase
MPGPQPPPLELSDRQRAMLEQLKRAQTNPHRLVQRARLILTMTEAANNQQAARQESCDRETARVWRRRWLAAGPHLAAAEARECSDTEFRALIETVLDDAARPGTPATFTAEQLIQLVALACEDPRGAGRPISHWTARELADELIKREIVTRISVRHVGRFLK